MIGDSLPQGEERCSVLTTPASSPEILAVQDRLSLRDRHEVLLVRSASRLLTEQRLRPLISSSACDELQASESSRHLRGLASRIPLRTLARRFSRPQPAFVRFHRRQVARGTWIGVSTWRGEIGRLT